MCQKCHFSGAIREVEGGIKIRGHPQALCSLGQVTQPFSEFLLQSKQNSTQGACCKKKCWESLKLLENAYGHCKSQALLVWFVSRDKLVVVGVVKCWSHEDFCCMLTYLSCLKKGVGLLSFYGGENWISAAAASAELELAAKCSCGFWKRLLSSSGVFLTGPFTLDFRLI